MWSEWRDLNSRPLDPQSSALPTALHPDIQFCGLVEVSLFILARSERKSKSYFQKNKKILSERILESLLTKHMQIWYHTSSVWAADTLSAYGEMSEWLKEPVLKTGDVKASVGSNPTLSANFIMICGSTQEAEGAPLLRE